MKTISVGLILLLALIGFALQPTRGRPVPVNLSALRHLPLTLGAFHAISGNDAELTSGPVVTDGSVGLERTYMNEAGTEFQIVVVPQTIGQHVPIMCDRYSGYTVMSESQLGLPNNPAVRFNVLTVRGNADGRVSTCLYYWKTAEGTFAPRPNHSLGMIAVRWSDHQQGLLVNVCSEGEQATAPDTQREMHTLLDASYQEIARLYSTVFVARARK